MRVYVLIDDKDTIMTGTKEGLETECMHVCMYCIVLYCNVLYIVFYHKQRTNSTTRNDGIIYRRPKGPSRPMGDDVTQYGNNSNQTIRPMLPDSNPYIMDNSFEYEP